MSGRPWWVGSLMGGVPDGGGPDEWESLVGGRP